MIKWPGKIKPSKSNEMISIHDFVPTLAKIINVKLPTDRPYDGVDQTDFLFGEQKKSNREHLISFVENEIAAVRWRHYRFYPKAFVASFGSPSQEGMMGLRLDKAGAPDIYNIEADPREQSSLSGTHGWLLRYIWPIMTEYNQSLKKYPNPPGVYMTGTDVGK